MIRTLSFSEITTALTCNARWDFAYGDQLAGSSLRSRAIGPGLSDGRAWGAAVAAWHGFSDHSSLECAYDPQLARQAAHAALIASYRQDFAEQYQAGVWISPEEELTRRMRLHEILEHYMAHAEKLPNLMLLEDRFEVPVPARSGTGRASTKYRFEGYIDGFTTHPSGAEWIVEFKLRNSLTSRKQLDLGRQFLWYAWAYSQISSHPVVGVIVDERLNEAPHAAWVNKDGRPSKDKSQHTSPELYLEACQETDTEPDPEMVRALQARRWQQTTPILFRPGQLEEAGRELVSAGALVTELDRGDRYPIRNGLRHICSGCRYSDICANPTDELYVDTLFSRVPPKRARIKEMV
jgi:hypothetical protein